MKRLLVFAVLVAVITLAGFWSGRKMCAMAWPRMFGPVAHWQATLGLTAEQAAEFKTKEAAFRKEADGLCMQVCEGRLKVLEMLEGQEADEAQILRTVEAVGAVQTNLEKKVAAHILEVKKNLDSRQGKVYVGHIREQISRSMRQCNEKEFFFKPNGPFRFTGGLFWDFSGRLGRGGRRPQLARSRPRGAPGQPRRRR
ncbi:MAG: periplasmic heavy metal sensor [Candidatus Omnitrophica bacterium]|nr:periplasmic heavy metal sensor [Candidatus Omnitrophota bacterium]